MHKLRLVTCSKSGNLIGYKYHGNKDAGKAYKSATSLMIC